MRTFSWDDFYHYGGYACLFLGLFGMTWFAITDETGFANKYWFRYTGALERKLRPMFIFTPGRHIAYGQILVIFMLFTVSMVLTIPYWWIGLFFIGATPMAYIEYLRRKRIEQIESQLDSFIVALANALKSTPSIGAAFASLATVIQNPLKQEVELALKEMKVGSSLEQALQHMAARVGSRQLDNALSAILIGRQVGGNLPRVLDTTAANMREMQRLEGTIKTKTAEGRMQLWVIGALPFILVLGMDFVWPGYFTPLRESLFGWITIGICAACWITAVIAARKVLAVDI